MPLIPIVLSLLTVIYLGIRYLKKSGKLQCLYSILIYPTVLGTAYIERHEDTASMELVRNFK